jgi:hypothetical protein
MSLFQEIKTIFIPKKLWILRLYVALLTFISEGLLALYIGLSIYNLITSQSVLGNVILGVAGFYLVWVCLALLLVAQVVTLFLNIHDNVQDLRNKALDPNFSINIEDDKEKNQSNSLKSLVTITAVILSIIFSFVNLNRSANSRASNRESGAIGNKRENSTTIFSDTLQKNGIKNQQHIKLSDFYGNWYYEQKNGWFFKFEISDSKVLYLEYRMSGNEILSLEILNSQDYVTLSFSKNEITDTDSDRAGCKTTVGYLKFVSNNELQFIPTGQDPCGYLNDNNGLGVFKNGNILKLKRIS